MELDPVEQKIVDLLEERKKTAQQYIIANPTPDDQDNKIPYSINKTISYLKTEEYLRKQKALKKQADSI